MRSAYEVYECGIPRREMLIRLGENLEDVNSLAQIVGINPVLDCALAYVAEVNPTWQNNLSQVLNVGQLKDDVTHVSNSSVLRKQRNNVVR